MSLYRKSYIMPLPKTLYDCIYPRNWRIILLNVPIIFGGNQMRQPYQFNWNWYAEQVHAPVICETSHLPPCSMRRKYKILYCSRTGHKRTSLIDFVNATGGSLQLGKHPDKRNKFKNYCSSRFSWYRSNSHYSHLKQSKWIVIPEICVYNLFTIFFNKLL